LFVIFLACNTNVGAIYLGACMGLYPAVAFLFCLMKILPMEMEDRLTTATSIFFIFWLALTVYAFFLKNYYKINRQALFLAGSLGILIPVLNGLHSGLWFWKAIVASYDDSAFIDLAWLTMGIISLTVAWYMKPTVSLKERKKLQKEQQSKQTENESILLQPEVIVTANRIIKD
ncbi:MAG: hypothetical protein AAFP82_02005, partial [Bacteroidota bacterium]